VAVSPADFELYSRASGIPYPRTAEERMRMAPAAHDYARNYAKTERTPGVVSRAAGGLGKAALGALAIGGIAALAGNQRGDVAPDDGGGPTEPPTRVGQKGFVRIPEERAPQEEPPKVRQVRNVEIPPKRSDNQVKVKQTRTPYYSKEQYGNVVSKNDADLNEGQPQSIREAAENKAKEIFSITRGGRRDLANSDYGYGTQSGPLERLFHEDGPIARFSDNVKLEQHIPRGLGDPLLTGELLHQGMDAVKIMQGTPVQDVGSVFGVPVGQTATELGNRIGSAIMKNDPIYNAASNVWEGTAQISSDAAEWLSNLGFPMTGGKTVGDLGNFIASNAPGSEQAAHIFDAFKHLGHTAPLEVAATAALVAAATAGVGAYRGYNQHKRAGGPTIKGVFGDDFHVEQAQIREIYKDHAQLDGTGPNQVRLPANERAQTGLDPQGGQAGLGKLTPDVEEEISFPFIRDEQQGPATHLIRRSAEREANPRYRYKGAKGISSDPSTGRTDIYFRASPEATGGTGVQKRSFYSEDPATGRYLEHDALDTTQPGYQDEGYMMDEKALKAKSFMSKFSTAMKRGTLLDAVDDAGETLKADDPWWER